MALDKTAASSIKQCDWGLKHLFIIRVITLRVWLVSALCRVMFSLYKTVQWWLRGVKTKKNAVNIYTSYTRSLSTTLLSLLITLSQPLPLLRTYVWSGVVDKWFNAISSTLLHSCCHSALRVCCNRLDFHQRSTTASNRLPSSEAIGWMSVCKRYISDAKMKPVFSFQKHHWPTKAMFPSVYGTCILKHFIR